MNEKDQFITAKNNAVDINWHLSREGMSDKVINDLLAHCGVSDRYRGTFLYNNLPYDIVNDQDEFIIIINVGFHFVTLYITKTFVLYIDSFGLPIRHLEIIEFIANRTVCTPVYYNTHQIQSLSSTHCGLFAAMFVLLLDTQHHRSRIGRRRRRQFHFYKQPSRLKRNDKLCVNYLKTFF